MKSKPSYVYRLFESKYLNPEGIESLPDVRRAFSVPVNQQSTYNCLNKHFPQYLAKNSAVMGTEALLDLPADGQRVHELALDEFIAKGRAKVMKGELQINAANYISAIKTKAEIEKTTKDRRLEMLKTMFSGAAPGEKLEA